MSVPIEHSPEIALRPVEMHIYRPTEPVEVTITRNDTCTGKKAAGFVRHIEFDVSGTNLVGRVFPGQSIGVLADGLDANGKPHKLRLYSIANPTGGEDGQGVILSTTVKRTIDEHWESHKLFLGVCSNFLCDRQVGEKIRVSGPNGKKFVLPQNPQEHDYLLFATGTGIAPFRGMVMDLLRLKPAPRVALVMGSPFSTDLIYHDLFTRLAAENPSFTYLTAISRERNGEHDRLYVQDRIRTDRERLMPLLTGPRTLVYICGLAGMELGIFQEMARVLGPSQLEPYIRADAEAMANIGGWNRSMLHKQVRPTRRVFMEVYA